MIIESLFSSKNYQASKKLLDAATLRHEGLATNLANVETPGYKRVDLPKTFAAEFAARMRAGTIATAAMPKLTEDLAATIYHALGIDHELRVPNAEDRPTPVVEGGEPVTALWS